MNRNNKPLVAAGVACLLATRMWGQEPALMPAADPVNDTARVLAGMAAVTDPALAALTRENAWQQHARYFDTAWAALEKNQLGKVRAWASARIPDAFASKATAFYMFSGPDFLYADTFFPQAATYVLCGMEPVGPRPDLTKIGPQALAGELRTLQESLNSVLSFSFFITKDMKSDFRNHALSGTLPILYIFLARSGKTLTDVSEVSLDQEGVLTSREDGARSAESSAPGVRIHFLTAGSSVPQTLYYFSTDISDSGLKHSGFLKFCRTLAPGNACVKSASYLMHEAYFSTIRRFLLENADTLVQDDSGIPCSYFTPELWQLRFYGSYPGPIALFKQYRQAQLADAYRTSAPEPLDFGIGYRHRAGESTLMVATHKPPGAAPVDAPPPRARIVPEENSSLPPP